MPLNVKRIDDINHRIGCQKLVTGARVGLVFEISGLFPVFVYITSKVIHKVIKRNLSIHHAIDFFCERVIAVTPLDPQNCGYMTATVDFYPNFPLVRV